MNMSIPYRALLGGSWVVISGLISPLIWVISIVTLLITPLITTHEPPSTLANNGKLVSNKDPRSIAEASRVAESHGFGLSPLCSAPKMLPKLSASVKT